MIVRRPLLSARVIGTMDNAKELGSSGWNDFKLITIYLPLDVSPQTSEPPVIPALVQRLKMTAEKVETLAVGVEQLADMEEPIGRELKKSELAEGLELTQVTVPIGVLLIVFESRPDSLVQIASLSLRSGNGLLLKGGKEAEHSNTALHKVVVDAVVESSEGRVGREVVALVTSREEVSGLLQLDDSIDLVIPRGGKSLVEHIKKHTRIPVRDYDIRGVI